jgi:hypothetical protein
VAIEFGPEFLDACFKNHAQDVAILSCGLKQNPMDFSKNKGAAESA